jgi:hypothetical protein
MYSVWTWASTPKCIGRHKTLQDARQWFERQYQYQLVQVWDDSANYGLGCFEKGR